MIVLDTTVLVYATGSAHLYREPCRHLVETIAQGGVPATTTVEVIQEFVHVRARRRGRQDAAALGRDLADLLSPLAEIGQEQLARGLEIYRAADRIGAFDSVLAAAALDLGALVSADSAFAEVPDLQWVEPTESGIAEILAGR